MGEFSDIFEEGFDEVAEEAPSTIAHNGLTATCVAGNSLASKELRDSGLWAEGSVVVEMKRTEFSRLRLADRLVVTLDGKKRQLFVIEDDPADPLLRLHLKPTHGQ
jgi:hypothetical protein